MAQSNNVDQDTAKGAMETENHETPGNIGLQRQLGHRDQDPMLKDADTDFPEPYRSSSMQVSSTSFGGRVIESGNVAKG